MEMRFWIFIIFYQIITGFFRTLPLKPLYPVRGRGCRMRGEDDAGKKGYPYSVFWQD
jgi:hypothetical protein